VPGRISAFHVAGSAAVGELRPGRSDLDFVATVGGGELAESELRRLRALHMRCWLTALAGDVALRRRWPLVCNGLYLREGDLGRPPGEVTPLAAQAGGRFRTGTSEGFDVSPVAWQNLASHGVALRGAEPRALAIHVDATELRSWLAANLDGYWRRWAARARGVRAAAIFPRRAAAAGVLGVSRVHYTLATGEIASKLQAGRYALRTFDDRWHGLIEEALDYWEGRDTGAQRLLEARRRLAEAAAYVEMVAGTADTPGRCENR
jgi:hypothetical protein